MYHKSSLSDILLRLHNKISPYEWWAQELSLQKSYRNYLSLENQLLDHFKAKKRKNVFKNDSADAFPISSRLSTFGAGPCAKEKKSFPFWN